MLQQGRNPIPTLSSEKFFTALSADVVARVETFAYQRQYAPRQIVFFPDDRCDSVFLVVSGRVKLTQVSDQGREICFRHLVRGDLFGEECLVNRPRRGYYAEALSPTLLTLIRSADFIRLVREEPELGHAVACALCRRGLDAERALSAFVFSDVRERVLQRLWELYCREKEFKDESLSVTHQDLANLVGAARETVTCVLHKLQDEGIITLANRRIKIKQPKVLFQMAGTD